MWHKCKAVWDGIHRPGQHAHTKAAVSCGTHGHCISVINPLRHSAQNRDLLWSIHFKGSARITHPEPEYEHDSLYHIYCVCAQCMQRHAFVLRTNRVLQLAPRTRKEAVVYCNSRTSHS